MIINHNMTILISESMLKTKYLLVISMLTLLTAKSIGQDDQSGIKETIQKMFLGMSTFDSTLVKSTFTPDFFLKSIMVNKAGQTVLAHETGETFLQAVAKKEPGLNLEEKLLSYQIFIDGPMAMVWTPYEFYINQKLNHCGVNLFTMVKINQVWKILGITDTRRKEPCG